MENNNLTLLIMAAGMGSRFGGLKQIEPFGPNGEFLIDYSIDDDLKVGFNKVVFIIKEENYDLFKETVGKRIEDKIKVEYSFQKQEAIPSWVNIPDTRVKPWGTAHAILSAKDKINESFAVINADDFYGRDAFNVIADFLKNNITTTDKENYALVGYKTENTLTENGSVKRGVCDVNDNKLVKLTESSIIKENNIITATPLDKSPSFTVNSDTLVSMNMLGFNPSIFTYIEENMEKFFKENENNLESCEFLIPDILTNSIKENYAEVSVLPTTAKWIGVTYKEDKESVLSSLNKLIEDGEYPYDLWK